MKIAFFPYTIKAWKNLDEETKTKPSVESFKKQLNKFIRPPGHSLFGLSDKIGIKLLTKIRVEFSDLRDHRINHNFNCIWSICRCGLDDETHAHFFLRCPMFAVERVSLLSKISDILHTDISVLPSEHLVHILLYGSNVYNAVTDKLILNETITSIRNTGRFTTLEAFR